MSEVADWARWSREAVAEMQARNREWVERYALEGAPYRWDLESAALTFTAAGGEVTADICLVGTTAHGTFLWAWANDGIPPIARRGLEAVRAFGETNGLPQLTTAEWLGGRAEGLEMLAAAGRIQQASGVFADETDEIVFYFTLSRFRAGGPADPERAGPR
jgi:hypothetical protein